MIVVGKTSSRQDKVILERAKAMRQDLIALGNDLGKDAHSATETVSFSNRAIHSGAIKGTYSGKVEMENGQLKLFRLFDANGRSAAGYVADSAAAWARQDCPSRRARAVGQELQKRWPSIPASRATR